MKKQLTHLLLIILIAGCAQAQRPILLWETEPILEGPESVVYDPVRGVLYASCLRKERQKDNYYGKNFISKVGMDGQVIDLKWIEGLSEPTGICIFNDQLYIVERFGVVCELKRNPDEMGLLLNTKEA